MTDCLPTPFIEFTLEEKHNLKNFFSVQKNKISQNLLTKKRKNKTLCLKNKNNNYTKVSESQEKKLNSCNFLNDSLFSQSNKFDEKTMKDEILSLCLQKETWNNVNLPNEIELENLVNPYESEKTFLNKNKKIHILSEMEKKKDLPANFLKFKSKFKGFVLFTNIQNGKEPKLMESFPFLCCFENCNKFFFNLKIWEEHYNKHINL